jgi:hypothetical protein
MRMHATDRITKRNPIHEQQQTQSTTPI